MAQRRRWPLRLQKRVAIVILLLVVTTWQSLFYGAVAAEAAAPELRVTRRTAAVTAGEPHPGWRRFLHDAATVPGVPRSIIKLCEGATGV